MNKYWLIILVFGIYSCGSEDIGPSCDGDLNYLPNDALIPNLDSYAEGVYILNEGGYNFGNASITYYNPLNNNSVQNVFEGANGIFYSPGDVLQSALIINSQLLLTVNNSQKIDIVDLNDFQKDATITGFTSPRYIEDVNDSMVIVTDFLANKVMLVNIHKGCVVKELKTDAWTENIIPVGNEFWILERSQTGAANEFARLLVVDASLNKVGEVDLPIEPNSIVLDGDNNIWVLHSGKQSDNLLPSLVKVNTTSRSSEQEINFMNWTDVPLNLVASFDGQKMYYSKGSDIFEMLITNNALPSSAAINTTATIVYKLSIPKADNLLYVSDAKDYQNTGEVLVYDLNSTTLTHTIPAGVIPSQVLAIP